MKCNFLILKATMVADEDVKKQETRVKEIRKNLENLIKEYNDLRLKKNCGKNLMELTNSLEN